jgi:hypothetical protein
MGENVVSLDKAVLYEILDFHDGEDVDVGHLGCDAVQTRM